MSVCLLSRPFSTGSIGLIVSSLRTIRSISPTFLFRSGPIMQLSF